MVDITDEQRKIVFSIIHKFLPHCEIRVFGSRYKGNAKKYSDLDLAIFNEEKPDWKIFAKIRESFQESELPFRVDVLDWHSLSPEFKKIIESGYQVLQV